MKNKIILIGASGHARVVIETVNLLADFELVGLIDDFQPPGSKVVDAEVLGGMQDLPLLVATHGITHYHVSIGDNYQRYELSHKVRETVPALQSANIVHPSARISPNARLSRRGGVFVGTNCVLNSRARLHEGCLINTSAVVEHDCEMYDFASLAPSATLGGNCSIGTHTAIGIGATLCHRISVGPHSVIGAGSAVVNDLAGHVVAYGNPARPQRWRKEGDKYL